MMGLGIHPIHLAVFGLAMGVNIAGVQWTNAIKAKGHKCHWSWAEKRTVYYAYMLSIMALDCCLNRYFEISYYFVIIKIYALAFPLGLIDYYFSDVDKISMNTIVGSALWCSTVLIRLWLSRRLLGVDGTFIVDDFSLLSLGKEYLRFTMAAVWQGMLSDLIFSPMHRLEHVFLYAKNHKHHHEYVNKLAMPVLYHGTYIDDFFMPVTTTFGGFMYMMMASCFGMAGSTYSNVVDWLIIYNMLFSHAHDVRVANLLLPVPPALNFAAYHRVHHLAPGNNFGLTLPSDLIWDKLLNVQTIRDPVEAAKAMEKDQPEARQPDAKQRPKKAQKSKGQ